MKKTFGILAHVDAGKTTFSEQLLYHTNAIRVRGRVDHKDTFLDSHEIEKERGITIFSEQAVFDYKKDTYYLIDTPGHIDFSADMERMIEVLDFAILLISGTQGIQSHTDTIWKLLKEYHIPTFLFINKMDIETTDKHHIIKQVKEELSEHIVLFENRIKITDKNNFFLEETLKEEIAEKDDELLELYLETEEEIDWAKWTSNLIKEEKLVPCMMGSALTDTGIKEFFEFFHLLTTTEYEKEEEKDFSARIYKVRYNKQRERITFLKVLSGTLRIKDEISILNQENELCKEKVNQIQIIHGNKNINVNQVSAGALCAVSGLHIPMPGDGIGTRKEAITFQMVPTLKVRVLFEHTIPVQDMLSAFQILEEEEPMLSVIWKNAVKELHISIMGVMQLEILKAIVMERFGYPIEFAAPEVLYLETIEDSVMGYGHFEPLRHYAEVALLLEPQKNGTGISCESDCHVDKLALNYQNLILTHIMERKHRGVLIGAPITDIKITLKMGISHIKHTEGGDFREATYRAIRQGLEKAKNIILEPIYEFTISVGLDEIGRVLSDITKLSGKFENPVMYENKAIIKGTGPVATFFNYNIELLSFTKGTGSIYVKFAGYQKCHNQEEVIQKRQYQKDADIEYTSSSVFCAKGTSFLVKWDEAEKYMHSLKK